MSGPVEVALQALGVRCSVEDRGTLAVVTPAPDERGLEHATVRRDALRILREHGFTHAALEIADDGPVAAVGPSA